MTTALACASARAGFLTDRRGRRAVASTVVGAAIAVPIMARLFTATSWPLDEFGGVFIGAAVVHYGESRHPKRAVIHRGRRRLALTGCVAVAVLLIPAGWSYARILTLPGNANFDQRSIEWLRDNGMSQLVDRGESWWLWRHLPSATATITELPAVPIKSSSPMRVATVPASLSGPIRPPLAGEGQWSVAAADAHGVVQIATTYFRPDPDHPSLVAGVAWINSATTKLTLIAGTRQPGGGAGPAGGRVPPAARDSLLAVFNSGYKMKDTPGGAFIEGRLTRHMVDGLATLAVLPDGTATIGAWGSDVSADQGYIGIRQNLHLMVVDGKAVDGVVTNAGGRWGTVRNALPTWRSGLGVTATGNVVYVAGNHLTLGVLADALVASGAVTAMELDIHKGMVTFNLFTHQPELFGHKLLPDMTRAADRYLSSDWRDFIMVTSR
jgi:hypothetical protein